MTKEYFERFSPSTFPRPPSDHILFTSGDLVDHAHYLANHPHRQQQVDRAKGFLQAFESDRRQRERELFSLLQHRHREKTVLAMVLNKGFTDLLLNWVESCDRHDIEVRSWTLIVAMDESTAQLFEGMGFAVYCADVAYGVHGTAPAGQYGDMVFQDMMFPKNAVVQDLLNLGFDVLFQDVDMVWKKDPAVFLMAEDRKILDAQFMYDGPNVLYAPLHANSGFFFLRNSQRTRRFWQMVYENFDKVYVYGGQQRIVNMLLVQHYFRGLRIDLLAESGFANGHLFTWDDVSQLPPDPYVIHCSWTKNIDHKLKKYRLAKIWYL